MSRYAGWIAQYRRGLIEEVAPKLSAWDPGQLLSVQSKYLDALDQRIAGRLSEHRNTVHVFQGRLTTALFHAELMARFGGATGKWLDLVGQPLDAIRRRWPLGAPAAWREAAGEAWGEDRTDDLRALLRREVFLMVARSRLVRLDNTTTRRVLVHASRYRDPAVEWQLGASNAIQARYLGDTQLWPDARGGLRDGVRGWDWSASDLGATRCSIVRAMADPDELQLRFAMVAIGRRYYRAAAADLAKVRAQVAPRLRIPRSLLHAELDLREGRLRPAMDYLGVANRLEPTSPAAAIGLIAAYQAAGRWDEAAALASELVSGREARRPWLAFITTWAEFGEGLPWLREVAGIG